MVISDNEDNEEIFGDSDGESEGSDQEEEPKGPENSLAGKNFGSDHQVLGNPPKDVSGPSSGGSTFFTFSDPICDSLGCYPPKELDEMERLRSQLQQEQGRALGMEIQLSEAKAEIFSLDRDAASEYRRVKKKLEIKSGQVATLQHEIHNKYDKIDRQASKIEEIQSELLRYQRFEYVPDEMDNLRVYLIQDQRASSEKSLLAESLESQCGSLRLQIRDLHSDHRRLLQAKDSAERSTQELEGRLQNFNQISKELEWVQAQLSVKGADQFVMFAVEQGKVRSLEEEVTRLKASEAQLIGKVTFAETASAQLTLQVAEEKGRFATELAEKVKAGIKEFREKKRDDLAAKKAGSDSAPPKE
ncbi:myosin-9-like [Papaver somniferum]|uniref:myosin-9-like n=1 Tax=Papaver somniferum TaxID=3469 RepID=UPI000E701357|nr:myosin-9-like [Papaver somniferum]